MRTKEVISDKTLKGWLYEINDLIMIEGRKEEKDVIPLFKKIKEMNLNSPLDVFMEILREKIDNVIFHYGDYLEMKGRVSELLGEVIQEYCQDDTKWESS